MPKKFERFTERARRVMILAREEAQRLNHDHIGPEHLLLGVIGEGEGVASKVLTNLGLPLAKVRTQVESALTKGEHPVEGDFDLTTAAKKAIELAADEARQFGHHYVGTEHLLLGLLREGEGIAATALQGLGITLEAADAEVERVLATPAPAEESPEPIRVPGGQIWRQQPATVITRRPHHEHPPRPPSEPSRPEPAAPPTTVGALIEDVRAHLNAKHAAREQALALCRDALRHSANAIRAVHRGEFPAAEALLAQARGLLEQASQALADHPDIFYAGFVHNAAKEFAEGSLTLALVSQRPLPSPQELGVDHAAYLNGLGEAVGELRRYLLDSLRSGDIDRCEGVLAAMDDIYTLLVTMDYPEAITGGLRRTTDAMRGILERTRGDLTMALVQRDLQRRLEEFQGRL
ncbi:MAG: Clp protease N-terminal domain-containing protein, partial [Longimicrobiales bacterium]|nr:Clp protease N-terminal domain-containing protein [Longimicrobiales bacterium]